MKGNNLKTANIKANIKRQNIRTIYHSKTKMGLEILFLEFSN